VPPLVEAPASAAQAPAMPVPPVPPTPGPAGASRIAPGRHMLHRVVILKWAISSALPMMFALLIAALQPLQMFHESMVRTFGAQGTLFFSLALIAGVIVVIALFALYSWLEYRNFSWEVTQTELHVYKGVISRHQTHIPYPRIHSIDTQAKVLDRILGIVTLEVQTPGGSRPEAVIPGLTLAEVEALRDEIFLRKREMGDAPAAASACSPAAAVDAGPTLAEPGHAGASGAPVPAGMPVPPGTAGPAPDLATQLGRTSDSFRGAFGGEAWQDEPVEFEYRLTLKEIFLSALTGQGAAIMFIGIIGAILSAATSSSFTKGVVESAAAGAQAASAQLGAQFTFIMVAGFLLICLIIWMCAIVGTMINYGGFVVRRRGDRVETEYGLLQHRFNGIALTRIQSITVKRGFVRRLFGYASIIVSTVGDGGSGEAGSNSGQVSLGTLVHPFIRYDQVRGFIASALPEFSEAPVELEGLPRVSRRRAVNRRVLGSLLVVAAAGIPALAVAYASPGLVEVGLVTTMVRVLAGIVVAAFAIAVISGLLWYRHAAFATSDGMLALRHGSFTIEEQYVPRNRIQWMCTQCNPFQRAAEVQTIRATTAAAGSAERNMLRDLAADRADDLLDWARPHAPRD